MDDLYAHDYFPASDYASAGFGQLDNMTRNYPQGTYDNNMRMDKPTAIQSMVNSKQHQYASLPEPLLRRQMRPIESFGSDGVITIDSDTILMFIVFVMFLFFVIILKQVGEMHQMLTILLAKKK